MPGKIFTAVTQTPIEIQKGFDFVADPTHGAATSFIGIVRNHNLGKDVTGVSYDCFDTLAQKVFTEICQEAQEKWGKSLNCYCVHFQGRLPIGGLSIALFVSSPHRDESFQACRYLIEQIKHRAPIWKQEHYVDGDSEWVKGHALCQHSHA